LRELLAGFAASLQNRLKDLAEFWGALSLLNRADDQSASNNLDI
jgi:hypothetical protein